jgi:lysophospholipid acyltransferase (LPLAT)-like uncharacterized protein
LLWRCKMLVAPLAWRLYRPAWRINTTHRKAGPIKDPVIFACLHRDILPAIRYCRPARPTLLVSKSPDGQILKRTIGGKDYAFVMGSTGHDGGRGFKDLLRVLRCGHNVGLAVDGPRGPFGHVHDGVLLLARRSGCAILPLRIDGGRCIELRTWDKTIVPLPLARVRITECPPIRVPIDADDDVLGALRRELGLRMGLCRKEARAGA